MALDKAAVSLSRAGDGAHKKTELSSDGASQPIDFVTLGMFIIGTLLQSHNQFLLFAS